MGCSPIKNSVHPRRLIRDLIRSDRGSVAIETVILTPLMVFLLVGFSALYFYMRVVSSVEHTAFTLADSIGQMSEVINDSSTSNADNLGSIWAAAVSLSAPNTLSTNGAVIVTSVCDGLTNPCGSTARDTTSMAAGSPMVYWTASAPWNAKGMTTQVATKAPLPSAWPFRDGDSALIVEVFYSYNPFAALKSFWPGAPGTQTIYKRVYVRPRGTSNGLPLQLVAS